MAKAKKTTAPVTRKIAGPRPGAKAVHQPWHSIVVIDLGLAQLSGHNVNHSVDSKKLKSLPPLLKALATRQQQGTHIAADTLRTMNIFNGRCVDFIPTRGQNKFQRFDWKDVKESLVDNLYKEIKHAPAYTWQPVKAAAELKLPSVAKKAAAPKKKAAKKAAKPGAAVKKSSVKKKSSK